MVTPNVVGWFLFSLCQLLVLVLSSGDGLAQAGSIKHSPSDVVKRYVELDHKGARLDAMSAETVASYTGWNEEPAWGHVVVTQGFVVAEQYRQWEVIDRLEVIIPPCVGRDRFGRHRIEPRSLVIELHIPFHHVGR